MCTCMKQQSDMYTIYMCTRDKMWTHLSPAYPVQLSLTDDYKGGTGREREKERERERRESQCQLCRRPKREVQI